jgi:hypothetical protein
MMLKYLAKGISEEVSNRLGKLVRTDKFSQARVDCEAQRDLVLDAESFLRLAPLAPADLVRYQREAEQMIGAVADESSEGIYKHIIGAECFSLAPGALFHEALNDDLLAKVTAYFGARPLLHGARLLVTEPTGETGIERDQMWHRDRYDASTLRLFIYLDECALAQGPFRYLPRAQSDRLLRTLVSRVSDEYLDRRGDLNHAVEVVGSAGDRFVADVRKLVHCGSRITTGRRLVFNAIYTTPTPWKAPQMPAAMLDELLALPLSELQRSALLR